MAFEIERQKIAVFVCKNCKGLDGMHFCTTKKRCLLCGRLTQPLDSEFFHGKKDKHGKKIPKDAQRFPRELAADKEQSIAVNIIQEKCRDFDCPGRVMEIRKGPMVTEYEFAPDRFTRLKKLKTIHEDLAMSLEAETVTVQRLVGKGTMSISISNKERKPIMFQDCLKNVIAHRDDMALPINFGVTSTGEAYVEDLALMPHLLISGQTGAGKSVFINNILTSLLYVRSPKEMELILIDPKSVELFPYKGLPHLKHEPVAGVYEALQLLETMIQEMKRRTSHLHFTKVKNLKEYNEKMKASGHPEDCLPYIVIVIDEMADIILQEKKVFTEKMAQISAMARAAGIHVIACTQRPSVDILSGKIKVNFPARVAFRVPSNADSKTILNVKGAETLLGKGDMFYMSPIKGGLQRLHAPMTTKADVDQMMKLSIEIGHVNNVPADGVDTKRSPSAGLSAPVVAVEEPEAKKKAGKGMVN